MSRTHLGRATALTPSQRLLYRALIDAVIDTGEAPTMETMSQRIGLSTRETSQIAGELVEADWIATDDEGTVTCVYPFSIAPTGINASWDNVERAMMCAVDALGAAPMLDKPVLVRANCQHCNRAITIEVEPERLKKRTPRSTVVIRRWTAGPAAANRCAATRFACSPDHAQQWLHEHGGPDDVIQSLEASFIEGRAVFGSAYRHGSSAHLNG